MTIFAILPTISMTIFAIADLSDCQLVTVPDAVYHLLRNTTLVSCNLASNVISKISPKFPSKFSYITGSLGDGFANTSQGALFEISFIEAIFAVKCFISPKLCLTSIFVIQSKIAPIAYRLLDAALTGLFLLSFRILKSKFWTNVSYRAR